MSYFAIYHVKSEIISNEGIIGAPALKHNEAKRERLFEVVFDFLLATKLYIPRTLNIALLQWHTHWNVCAVK